MKKIQLVVDVLLDDADFHRLSNTKPGYLYLKESNSLYLKHINHLDHHSPYLAISYGKENHMIMNLETGSQQKFLINHQELDEFYSVALGVTDDLAMLALGDSNHTRIQVVDVNQPVKVHYNGKYNEPDATFFPVPRYFTGTTKQATLVYSDNSRLPIDLQEMEVGNRVLPDVDQIVRSKTVIDPHLDIFGPFLILTITQGMTKEDLLPYKQLIITSQKGNWIVIDERTLLNTQLVDIHDFDDLIAKKKQQTAKLLQIIDSIEN